MSDDPYDGPPEGHPDDPYDGRLDGPNPGLSRGRSDDQNDALSGGRLDDTGGGRFDGLSDDRLAAILISIGHNLDVPDAPAALLGPFVAGEPAAPSSTHRHSQPRSHRSHWSAGGPGRRRRPQHLLAVAAAVAIGVLVALAVPTTRAAIADRLGIGSTSIEIDVDIGDGLGPGAVSLPHVVDGLPTITASEAATIVGRELPDASATALGRPDALHAMPEGGVLMVWAADATTLWVRPEGDDSVLFRKLVATGEDVERVGGVGEAAAVITTPHVLETPRRTVRAGAVLLWRDGGVEYRLESDLDRDGLVALGRVLG